MKNMRVKDLKDILNQLPDDMPIIVPVIDEDNCNRIFGFRYVRTAGILTSQGEKDDRVICLNAADKEHIADQVYFSGKDVGVEKVLYGTSKYEESCDHND